jgi:glutamine amidotransferase
MQRGGGTGPHRDGWGIVFYEGRGVREFRDPTPSVNSEVAQLVQRYPIKSRYVISHIRQANVGDVCLENTHPFVRELWGEYWSFAHNGQLSNNESLPIGKDMPVGSTDSERAFCWLLDRLRETFDECPGEDAVSEFIFGCCEELRAMGVFNMLLSNGRVLMAYCTTQLHWLTRKEPFGEAQLTDADFHIDFAGETTDKDVVTVVATQPLTNNETWQAFKTGDMLVFVDGHLQRSYSSAPQA